MKILSKESSTRILKVTGLVLVIATLSACHSLPVHHGSGGHGQYQSQTSEHSQGHGSHKKRSRSYSRDY